MVKSYYCDYCDRSFKDDVDARKKHISSLQHAKNRIEHYNGFKDPEMILKEECGKIPCKHYMTTGYCAFDSSCRFSHYTPHMIWDLQQFVAMKNSINSTFSFVKDWPNPEDIITEYFENVIGSNDDEEFSFIHYPKWSTSSELSNYSNLPPSLWPINPEDLLDCNFNKWGETELT